MLAANHPNEDHIHEPVNPPDPDRLPPRLNPLLPRLFLEQRQYGAIQTVNPVKKPEHPPVVQ